MKKVFALMFMAAFFMTNVAVANAPEEDKVYKETVKVWKKCKSCHGNINTGDATKVGKKLGAPENIFSNLTKQEMEDLKAFIMNGEGRMPAFKNKLSDEQIELISKFIIFVNNLTKVNRDSPANSDDIKPILFIDYMNNKNP
tara:strand:- start:29 stop:454 length:426 start_codon:yes stop_codon:yes gene_type:complete